MRGERSALSVLASIRAALLFCLAVAPVLQFWRLPTNSPGHKAPLLQLRACCFFGMCVASPGVIAQHDRPDCKDPISRLQPLKLTPPVASGSRRVVQKHRRTCEAKRVTNRMQASLHSLMTGKAGGVCAPRSRHSASEADSQESQRLFRLATDFVERVPASSRIENRAAFRRLTRAGARGGFGSGHPWHLRDG